MADRGWEAQPYEREGSGSSPGGPESIQRPPGGLGGICRPIRRAVRSREALPNGCEGLERLLEVQEGLGSYSKGPGEVGKHSQRAGRCKEAFLEGWETSGGRSGGP